MNLLAKLGLDISGFVGNLSKAIGSVRTFAAKFPSLGNAVKNHFNSLFGIESIISAVEESVKEAVKYAKDVGDLSGQLRISTEDIQKMMHVAHEAGLEFNDFARAIENIGKARDQALSGDVEYQQLFARYGISLDDLRNSLKDNLDIAKELASGLGKININSQTEADSLKLMGRHGERLIESIKNLKSIGKISLLDKDEIESLKKGADALESAKQQRSVFIGHLMAPVAKYHANLMAEKNEDLAASSGTFDFLKRRFSRLFRSEDSTITKPITREEIADRRKQLGLRGPNLSPVDGAKKHLPELKAPLITEGDKLAKIGLFVGGAGGPMVDINRQLLQVTREQLQEARMLRTTIERKY